MNRTNNELKKIAAAALKSEYGFAPSAKNIALLEASGDGTYILFRVDDHEYSFNSRLLWDGSVWAGSGCIEKRS